jgi:hypothetical protein
MESKLVEVGKLSFVFVRARDIAVYWRRCWWSWEWWE